MDEHLQLVNILDALVIVIVATNLLLYANATDRVSHEYVMPCNIPHTLEAFDRAAHQKPCLAKPQPADYFCPHLEKCGDFGGNRWKVKLAHGPARGLELCDYFIRCCGGDRRG